MRRGRPRAGYDRWASGYDEDDNPLIVMEERCLGDVLGDVAGLDLLLLMRLRKA